MPFWIKGTAAPNTKLRVARSGGGLELGTAYVRPDGSWELQVTQQLAAGNFSAATAQVENGTEVSPWEIVDFNVSS
ncbi:hypothetical protein [Pseudomonas sp. GM21]|uniref:hypothetical protein n=1 Tax=Pseudomonas sp. GM21 TaxID=1144325 RepID=UPI0002DCF5DE|nr:hypothetical protein [Pseudomonas sp. GM21]